jgi:hypothetical protein
MLTPYVELLRAKHPEPAHPDRDAVRVSSILWPQPSTLEEYWSSDAGTEFLDKWFNQPVLSHTLSGDYGRY